MPRLVPPEEPLEFLRPDAVKGIYLNAWAAGSSTRSQALIDLATRTEVNAFVIDLKDASGYVSYPTQVMTAREVGADQEIRIRDLVGLLERLQAAGIYPIARIVMVKDPLLIRARPEWAVQDSGGGVWVDSIGGWSGPTSTIGACGIITSSWRRRPPRSASLRSSGTTSALRMRPKRISTGPSTQVPRGAVAETPSRPFWSTPGPNWRIPASP